MEMSYQERIQWITLLSVGGIYSYYFARVIPLASNNIEAEHIAFFTSMVILLIVIHIIGAIVSVSLEKFREPETDERDQLIQLKSSRPASYILVAAMGAGMFCAYYLEGNFWVMHALLAGLVLSQVVDSASRIVHYRRGF